MKCFENSLTPPALHVLDTSKEPLDMSKITLDTRYKIQQFADKYFAFTPFIFFLSPKTTVELVKEVGSRM